MTEKQKTFYSMIIAILLCCVAMLITSFLSGCKPDMPVRDDYPNNLPCYLADRCITVNAYMENHTTDCTLALQKCYRYIDWEKCEKEKDFTECWNKLGIRM